MVKTPLQPLVPTSLSSRVYENLRSYVLGPEVSPGTFIREVEVAKALGVSRTPVREALARLASEGFIEHIPNRGFRIPEESTGDLLELYPILAALEVLAAKLAAPHLQDRDLRHLRELNDKMREAVEFGTSMAVMTANNRFHAALSQKSGNRVLCNLLDDLRSRVTRLESWSVSQVSHTQEACRQHEEILDAIERGDITRALEVLEQNRLQTYTAYQTELGVGE